MYRFCCAGCSAAQCRVPVAACGGAPAFDCGKAAIRISMFLIGDNGATGNDAVYHHL